MPLPPSASSPRDDSEFASFRLIGQNLGPYVIDGVLGRGGMGVVYQAHHQQIGQEVAIKVLRQRLSNDRMSAERLLKEARAITLVQHAGLVRIFDYQQTPDGSPYIVMERLRGQPLAERIQSSERSATAQPLPIDATVRIAEQVATALAAAHAAGIIHCGRFAPSSTSAAGFQRPRRPIVQGWKSEQPGQTVLPSMILPRSSCRLRLRARWGSATAARPCRFR